MTPYSPGEGWGEEEKDGATILPHHRGGAGPPRLHPAGPALFCFGVQEMPALGAEAMERRVCRRGVAPRPIPAPGRAVLPLPKPPEPPAWSGVSAAGLPHGGDTHSWVWGVTNDLGTVQGQTCVPPLQLQLSVANGCPQVEVSPQNASKRPKTPAPGGGRSGCHPEQQLGVGVAAGPAGLMLHRPWLHKRAWPRAESVSVGQDGSNRGATRSRRSGGHRPATAGPRGRTVPQGHLHKGRPVAAGRELGKKCLQWEESKYHCRDILIAGWRSLLIIFFNPFVVPFILIPVLVPSAPGWSFPDSSPKVHPLLNVPPFAVWPMVARLWWEEMPNYLVGKLRQGTGKVGGGWSGGISRIWGLL